MSEKYPRTPHLPGSPGATRDDRTLGSLAPFAGRRLVVTEKLDGSNVALTSEAGGVFARSHSGPPRHGSFDELKAVHAALAASIPAGLTLFGEWCHAVHSIEYPGLPGPGPYLFAVRDDGEGRWRSYEDVEVLAGVLEMATVPAICAGYAERTEDVERLVRDALASRTARASGSAFGPEREGIVLRRADGFYDVDFPLAVAKWVRAGHVNTDDHWAHGEVRRQPREGSKG